jgi:hypothetical protein
MILFVNSNSGILFIPLYTGGGNKIYGSGTVVTMTTVDGVVIGYGRMTGNAFGYSTTSATWRAVGRILGSIAGSSTLSATWRAVAKISGAVHTFTTVTGEMNTKITIIFLRIESFVKKILKIDSPC